MLERLLLGSLRRLYLHGPAWWGVGFWGGQAREDICSQLSTVPAAFWAAHPEECHALVEQHLRSFTIAIEFGFYGWAAYRALTACLLRWTVVHPIVSELRALRAAAPENLRLEDKKTA